MQIWILEWSDSAGVTGLTTYGNSPNFNATGFQRVCGICNFEQATYRDVRIFAFGLIKVGTNYDQYYFWFDTSAGHLPGDDLDQYWHLFEEDIPFADTIYKTAVCFDKFQNNPLVIGLPSRYGYEMARFDPTPGVIYNRFSKDT